MTTTFAFQTSLFDAQKEYLSPVEVVRCSGHRVALDVETTGLRWWSDRIIGIGLYCPDVGVHGYFPTLSSSEIARFAGFLSTWNRDTTVIVHNAKFDFHMLGISLRKCGWKFIDPTVLLHLLDSQQKKSLEAAEEKYLGSTKKKDFHSSMRTKKKKMWQWPLYLLAEYCENDVESTYRLAELLVPQVVAIGCWPLFTQLMKYVGCLWEIERRGMKLDFAFIDRSMSVLHANLAEMEIDLFKATGGAAFNWRSHQKLSKAIYEGLGIPKPINPFLTDAAIKGTRWKIKSHWTKTCTSSFILMEKAKHPLGPLIQDMREADKLLDALEQWVDLADNGVVHTNFNVNGTRTGRLSSSKPNVQNIPSETRSRETQSAYSGGSIRSQEYNLRQAFIPHNPSNPFVMIDYSQMEMRMFGILADDEVLLEALKSGEDIHASMAEQIWGIGDKLHREWAKTTSFGLIYGMSTGSLQLRLNMERERAVEVADQYWATYPGIKPFLEGNVRKCKKQGYVIYWSGRRWHEKEDHKLYAATNALVQGGSHDLLMVAVLRTFDFLESEAPHIHVCSLVHDEIDFEAPKQELAKWIPSLQHVMEVPDLFGLPFLTSVKVGHNYGSVKAWAQSAAEETFVTKAIRG